MTLQDNIAAKSKAFDDLKAHCLCLKVQDNIVFLPDGYDVGALRIKTTADGYIAATNKLEEIWKESMSLFSVGASQ